MGYFSDQSGGGGEGIATAKLKDVGDIVAGTITGTKFVGVTDYKTGQPVIDPGTGQQEQQLRIDIALLNGPDNYASASKPLTDDETKQVIPDNGKRAIYARKNTNISFAIARALEEHGLDDVRVGDMIWVRHTSIGTSRTGTQFKEHEAGYKPAAPTSGFDGFQQAQQQQAARQAPQQAYQQPAAPQAPQGQQAPPPGDPWAGATPAAVPPGQPQGQPQQQWSPQQAYAQPQPGAQQFQQAAPPQAPPAQQFQPQPAAPPAAVAPQGAPPAVNEPPF